MAQFGFANPAILSSVLGRKVHKIPIRTFVSAAFGGVQLSFSRYVARPESVTFALDLDSWTFIAKK